MKSAVKFNVIILMSILLYGCMTTGPSEVDFTYLITAANDINPNSENISSPVVLRVYQLSDKVSFENSSYHTLLGTEINALSIENISVSEYLIHPGVTKKERLQLSESVKYIGVAVGYRSTNLVNWHQIIATPSAEFWGSAGVKIELNKIAVNLSPL